MMENSKLKYFTYCFLLLPLTAVISYLMIRFFILYYVIDDGKYKIITPGVSYLLLSFTVLGLSLFFKRKNSFIKELTQYTVVLYISYVCLLMINGAGLNSAGSNLYSQNANAVELYRIYHITVIFTAFTVTILMCAVNFNALKFKKLHVVLLLLAIVVQHFIKVI